MYMYVMIAITHMVLVTPTLWKSPGAMLHVQCTCNCIAIIGASRSKPHINHTYEKITVLTCMYVCMYVCTCMYMYVCICVHECSDMLSTWSSHVCAHYAVDMVKILSVDHVTALLKIRPSQLFGNLYQITENSL